MIIHIDLLKHNVKENIELKKISIRLKNRKRKRVRMGNVGKANSRLRSEKLIK